MPSDLILASGSDIRRLLLERAGLHLEVLPARVDEQTVRTSLEASGTAPRDIADALAEAKALRVSAKQPGALVVGADQILEIDGEILSKAASVDEAAAQLARLSGRQHSLHAAAVAAEGGSPVWRHVATAKLTMRPLSGAFIADYLSRNWASVQSSVGCYKIEEEGPRLFARIDGSHFAVQGLPLLELLGYLSLRGVIDT